MPSVPMKSNINQNYKDNDDLIKTLGCAVCCATDVASSYGNVNITLTQMRDTYKAYTSANVACVWGNVPYAEIDDKTTSSTESACLQKIKSEVDSGRVVLVYMEGKLSSGKTTTHYVAAYGYWSDATHTNHISVFDPYTGNENATTGKDQSLTESLSTQGSAVIKGYRLCKKR